MRWPLWEEKEKLKNELKEKKPLPMGRAEFEEWSDRIIGLAAIPGATAESQKFVLADKILHIAPNESFVEDLYFVHCLRKLAANQIADAIRKEIRDSVKARLAEEEAKKQEGLLEIKLDETKVLADK